MFLPFAVLGQEPWQARARQTHHVPDPGLVARRLPDFVHQLLNQGDGGPGAMLELQTDGENGPVEWMRFEQVPDRDEVFELMPNGLDVRAVVTGEVELVEEGLRVEFHVFRREAEEDIVSERIGSVLRWEDPVTTLVRLARHLARSLDVPFSAPATGLLTKSSTAFFLFLEGLDNAMLLSGDLDIAVPDDRESLIRPFADALLLDPAFGLALRVANATTTLALDGERLERDVVRRFLDRCFDTQPGDGDACVAVADQLAVMGDDARAREWLEHAAKLDPPPARGLENLGILKARQRDLDGARALWKRGLEVDGHPDFFSHLAQLAFSEGDDTTGWQLVERGLWRLRERTVRAAEWDDQERSTSVMLECLPPVMSTRQPPRGVVQALESLRGLFDGEDRVDFGLCLELVGSRPAAREELTKALRAPTLELESRDRAVRALLKLAVPDFEKRFAKAVDTALRARDPRPALEHFAKWYEMQDEFWPALFFGGVARRRLDDPDGALDLFAEALELSPGQADVLYEMAELFCQRNNSKRALELVDQALVERPRLAKLHAARLRYLQSLGRDDEALTWYGRVTELGVDSPDLRRLGKALKRRGT